MRDPGGLVRGLNVLLGAPLRITVPDLHRLILWAPVALAVGAAMYFMPASEPPLWVGRCLVLAMALMAGIAVFVRARPALVFVLCIFSLLAAGFLLAQGRTHGVAPPPFEITERTVLVQGWIEKVERGGSRPRLLIRVASLSVVEDPPYRIRVRAGLNGFAPGDGVQVRAVLSRPPGPAVPGGYDPARAAWFDRVALSGFAVTRLSVADVELDDQLERGLVRYRWSLAERIRQTVGPQSGGVAAALLTGDRSSVEEDDAEALRISGLGHILAISGLHMALFAGGVYFATRLTLAAIEPFARAHDPRKPAAIIALVAATGYLILSGAAIPTQRAWVMAAVVLVGVLLDRRAFSMRSLALAAMAVLLLAPESVQEVGFQMSFASVAALIAVYEIWGRLRPVDSRAKGPVSKGVAAFGGLATTSLVAGAATGAFAAFHFQRFAAFGFIANLAAMPIFTFWVMPAGVIALALAPFGLEAPALAAMDIGLQLVLAIAHWTAGLDGAAVTVQAAASWVIGAYGLGFAALTIGVGVIRLAGAGLCAIALGGWMLQSPPELMVTDDGVVIAQFEADGVFQASSLRASRFETEVFLQRAGQGGHALDAAALRCDPYGCAGLTLDGVRLALTSTPEALAEDCALANVVVFQGLASAWQKRRCEAMLIDAQLLNEHGGLELRFKNRALTVSGTAEDRRHTRLWSQGPD